MMFEWLAKLLGRREKTEKEKVLQKVRSYDIPKRLARLETIETREYQRFKKEEFKKRNPRTWYEKSCKFSEKLRIDPDKKAAEEMRKQIEFCHMRVTPRGVASFSILMTLATLLMTLALVLVGFLAPSVMSLISAGGGIPTGPILLVWLLAAPIIWYLYTYPKHRMKRYIVTAGSEIVLFILYMVVYMRERPNLEGAVKFASRNLTGPLSYDIKKLMWDVEVGTYRSMDEALVEYANKWSDVNKEFVESIQLIRTSTQTSENKRPSMLDEAVSVILDGTEERARSYNRELKLPVMLVHALGILLPVMGLVMFPVVMLFLEDVVSPAVLIVIYDILLPFALFFLIKEILERRPVTFSPPDITNHPRLPPPGRFSLKAGLRRYSLPTWPFPFLISVPIVLVGVGLLSYMGSLAVENPGLEPTLIPSVVIVIGIGLGTSAYFILSSFQKLKLRKEMRNIEEEFTEALFQMGNRMSAGIPLEQALERSVHSLGNLSISKLFRKILDNIRRFGMNLEEAIFNPKYGAIREYPSKKIASVMHVVTESSKKGVQTAAIAMLQISRYLRGVHKTQQEVQALLEDVLSSMKFQAYILTPLVGGVIVTMAVFIIRILKSLAIQMQGLSSSEAAGMVGFLKSPDQMIAPGAFQLVVGIYVLETMVLLSSFINGIENGEDKIGFQDLAGKTLLIGLAVYLLALIITTVMFVPMTQPLLG